jgi:hypothetical protein
MRKMVLKAYTGDPPVEHPDSSFDTEATLTLLATDKYVDVATEAAKDPIIVELNGETYTSCERWLKFKWANDDTTNIANLRISFHSTLPQGVYLRVGYSKTYSKPSNEIREFTAMATFNYGGPNEIVPDDPETHLHVPVTRMPDDTYESDYVVIQLVADSHKVPLYDFLKTLAMEVSYDEY